MFNSQLKKLALHILLFIVLLFYSHSYSSTFIDDAFIQFQYAKILATTGTWGFFPGIITNTATSPLNVIILSILSLFTGNAVTAAVWLSAFEFFFLFVFLSQISQHVFARLHFGVFAFVALITNPLLLSTLGMESWLFLLLFTIALHLFLKGSWNLLSIVLGLLTLARPDGILLLVLLLLMAPSDKRLRIMFVYVLTVTPWYLTSWIYLGSFLPDTLLIKMGQRNWEGKSFSSGLAYFYFSRYPIATLGSFLLLPLGLFSVFGKNRDTGRLIGIVGVFVLLHFAGYSLLHVPPYHWYYVPLAAGSVLIGSFGVASFTERFSKMSLGLFLLIPILGLLAVAKQDGFPLTEAPIHTNWATKSQYEEIGTWLRINTDPAAACTIGGEIGTLAYYSDRRLINNFSSANELFRSTQRFRRTHGRLMNTLLDWNFFWRRKGPREPRAEFNLIHLIDQDWKRTPDVKMVWRTSSAWYPQGTLLLIKNR